MPPFARLNLAQSNTDKQSLMTVASIAYSGFLNLNRFLEEMDHCRRKEGAYSGSHKASKNNKTQGEF